MEDELTSVMSSEQDFTLVDPTEKTPVEVTHLTTGSSMTSWSSRGAGFYFQCAVLVVAVAGAAANALVLYAMVASKQHKKHVLILNQNVLDLVNCLFLVVATPMELNNIYLSGKSGYWLCLTFLSYAGSWAGNLGPLVNLAAISIERYLKVVHHVWAKNKLRNWIIYSAMALAWIIGIGVAIALTIPSAAVVNGVCYAGIIFLRDETVCQAITIWDFLSFYVIILLIFLFCYGRILVIIRRQAHVMAAHSGQPSSTNQDQSNKIQTSVIKTMILVSGLYAVTWGPMYIYTQLNTFHSVLMNDQTGLYTVLSIGYIYICTNPFIYATKFDPVKRVLLNLIPFKKNNTQASQTGGCA